MSRTLTPQPSRSDLKGKPYAKPQLITYGTVNDIVKGQNGVNSDAGQGANSKLGGG